MGFSVIVPVYNCADVVIKTLESIQESIRFFDEHYENSHQVEKEIIVVNDASTDNTLDILGNFVKPEYNYKIISHSSNLGAGAARNTGFKHSRGEFLFFCDGDDIFLKGHIYVCYRLISHKPKSEVQSYFSLNAGDRAYTIELPNYHIDAVKTRVRISDQIHPYWKRAIENDITINWCIRRECHEFVEGFPEDDIYKQIRGGEDSVYHLHLAKFFRFFRLDLETVEYIRYPGNALDKQMTKFQTAPELYQYSPAEIELRERVNKIAESKLLYLSEKYNKYQKAQSMRTGSWLRQADENLARGKYAEAIALYQEGMKFNPNQILDIKKKLAEAHKNLGSILYKQGLFEQGISHFQAILELNPDLSKTELAAVYFNIGVILTKQNKFEQALNLFKQALEIDPGFPQVHPIFYPARYSAQIWLKGYHFTQDWFALNIQVWEHYLRRFEHKPELNFLEIGSWEGRSTCWLLDNILTHDSARITCIDTFEGGVEHKSYETHYMKSLEGRFDFNIARTGASEKVRKIVGRSQEVLRSRSVRGERSLPLKSYDLIYIDGSHLATDVLEDGILSWGLVKVGGVIIFDDYDIVFSEKPTENATLGIDTFLKVFGDKIKLIHKAHQVIIEKTVN